MTAATDRELLELAAKAAGYQIDPHTNGKVLRGLYFIRRGQNWQPLERNDDAFCLGVDLRISLEMAPEHVYAVHTDTSATQYRDTGSGKPMDQVVREAIVACAAEVGRSMP